MARERIERLNIMELICLVDKKWTYLWFMFR